MRDEEIPSMYMTINAVESCMEIPDCMTVEETTVASQDDEHLGILLEHVLHSWPPTEAKVQKELQMYWSFKDEITIIDGIATNR